MTKTNTFFKFSKIRFAATLLSVANVFGITASTLEPSQAVVIGQDDRLTPSYEWMTTPGQPRRAMGQLETQLADGTYEFCSFTVVGPNIGLTNTHCLLDKQGRAPRQIKAYAVRYGTTKAYAAANVDLYWTGTDRAPATVQESTRDWAIVRFTTNLGNVTGWLGNMSWSTDVNAAGQSVVNQWTSYIGYPGDWPTDAQLRAGDDRGYTPALHAGCKILGIEDGLLLHDCDVTPGTSGASLYGVFSQTDLRIMGLNQSQGIADDGSVINAAVPLERFMPAIEALRATGAASNTIVPRP